MNTSVPDIQTAQQIAKDAEKIYYFDRIRIWLNENLTASELGKLRYANKTVKTKSDYDAETGKIEVSTSGIEKKNEPMIYRPSIWKHSLDVLQPTMKFFYKFNTIIQKKAYLINYVEVAVDFIIEDV